MDEMLPRPGSPMADNTRLAEKPGCASYAGNPGRGVSDRRPPGWRYRPRLVARNRQWLTYGWPDARLWADA
jgi:hypothetical protein